MTSDPITQAVTYAIDETPRECCGLISAADGKLATVYPITNVAPEPEWLYLMDPGEQLAAMAAIDASGEELAVVFHSHPRSAPVPSNIDIAQAFYPELLYIIIGLADVVPDVMVWRIVDGQATPAFEGLLA